MLTAKALVLIAPIVLGQAGSASPALATEARDRPDREAVAPFRDIIADEADRFQVCVVEHEWLRYAVIRETAGKYLDHTIHADLSPPHHVTRPCDIISKASDRTGLICSEDEVRGHIWWPFAEHEAEMIFQRTKAALAAAKARGMKLVH